jgi:hypothetical protein
MTYSYLLLSSINYEGTWTLGIVDSLDEALEYYTNLEQIKNTTEDWIDYIDYRVEVWDKTQKICTYKYSIRTNLLDLQEKKLNELGLSDFINH